VHDVQPLPDLTPRPLARLSLQALPSSSRLAASGTVVTFGIFDGVHRGHQQLLRRLLERATEIQATAVAIVMRPRPVETLGLAPSRPYLSSLEDTVARIREVGVDAVGILRFTRDLALAKPIEFLERLRARTRMRELWLGSRARIGRGPEGSIDSARAFGARAGFAVVTFEEVDVWEGGNQPSEHPDQLTMLNRALGRSHELPCYAGHALHALDLDFCEFPLAFPKLLYLPPRGEYAVRVRPGRLGGIDGGEPALPGTGVVLVHASEQGHRSATLIGPRSSNWADAFLILEFVAGRAPDARRLLDWAGASMELAGSATATEQAR
jgi:FAD synthase